MKTPIDFEQLWEVVTSDENGFLVIDPKTGLSSITRNTRKKYIRGPLVGDPLASYIFQLDIEELKATWSSSRNITEFCWQVNHRGFRIDKYAFLKDWATLFDYKDFGYWKSHGLPGIYDVLSDAKLDEVYGYYEIDLKMLTMLGDQAYTMIGVIWEKLHFYSMDRVVLLKPKGSKVEAIGQSHKSITALEVPERFRPMIESFNTVLTI